MNNGVDYHGTIRHIKYNDRNLNQSEVAVTVTDNR